VVASTILLQKADAYNRYVEYSENDSWDQSWFIPKP